jgi:hypothetical protein
MPEDEDEDIDDIFDDDEPEATASISEEDGVPKISIQPSDIGNTGEIAFDNDTGKDVYITMTVSYTRAIGVPHTVKVGS